MEEKSFLLSGGTLGKLLSIATAAGVLLVVVWGAWGGGKNQPVPPVEQKTTPAKQKTTPAERKTTLAKRQADSGSLSNKPAAMEKSAGSFCTKNSQNHSNKRPINKRPPKKSQNHFNKNSKKLSGKKKPAVSVEYDDHPLRRLSQPRIVIEKSSLRLTVYDGRQPVKRYKAAVGGSQGDKTRQGDLCTPEGEFYVCVRNTRSKYVLSLGLSYPNLQDASRGLRAGLINRIQYNRILYAIGRGLQPPWNTKLGGEIMIHGKRLGGRATLGCIALEDNDIRELFPQIPLGTKVTILP